MDLFLSFYTIYEQKTTIGKLWVKTVFLSIDIIIETYYDIVKFNDPVPRISTMSFSFSFKLIADFHIYTPNSVFTR